MFFLWIFFFLSRQMVLNLTPRDLMSLEKVGDHCLREKSVFIYSYVHNH